MQDGKSKYILFAVVASLAAAFSQISGLPLVLLDADYYTIDALLSIFIDLYQALNAPLFRS